MATLSQIDHENLQADSNSLTASAFVGVLVGHGSMILHFSNGSSVLVQCAFEVYDNKISRTGHGESSETSTLLFEFFNLPVVAVSVDALGQITFDFGAGKGIRIIPDNSGLESYVPQTPKGVFPVY
jgi:hypothetical protein